MVMILGLAGILIFFKHSYQVNTRFYSTLNRVPTDAVSTFIINIISVQKIISKNCTIEFKQNEVIVSKNAKILFKASLLNNLYSINLENKIIIENILLANTIKNSK